MKESEREKVRKTERVREKKEARGREVQRDAFVKRTMCMFIHMYSVCTVCAHVISYVYVS